MGRSSYVCFPTSTNHIGHPQRIAQGVSQAETVTSVSTPSRSTPSRAGRSDSGRGRVVITSQTSVPEAFRHLIAYGCPDITSDLSPWGTSNLIPCAGGRFGDVYKWANKQGRPVGIKCLRLHSLSESNAKRVKRAIRELYFWSKAKHRNVLELSGVTVFNGQLAMVSPWMDNGHLQQYVRHYPDADRWTLCIQVAEGLTYLHGIGMVHGDLKAINVLVSNDGVVKISDFGNSILEECSLGFTATVTIGGGSLRWMAYELMEANIDRSTMTDVYSLAMTILEVLSAQVPYIEYLNDPQVMRALLLRILPARPEQLSEQANWGNERWELLINCWDAVPSLRPTSVEVLSRMRELC